MQQYKDLYVKENYTKTFSNIQTCLRLNDWEEIGDGTHFLLFHMIGLFSFNHWSLSKSIDFMWDFLSKLNITPDYVTIHPDKMDLWKNYYEKYSVEIREDKECIWSDGEIKGYCTEFYKKDVEIGNIVNTLGKSIDIGFGLERLLQVTGNLEKVSALETVEKTVLHLLNEGVVPGHKKSGYQLKKMLNYCVLNGSLIQEEHFIKTKENLKNVYKNYERERSKIRNKNKEDIFWLDTFGFDINQIEKYKNLF